MRKPDEVFLLCYTHFMDKVVLFIDGENFLHKVENVLKKDQAKIGEDDLSKINLNFLLEKTLEKYKVSPTPLRLF